MAKREQSARLRAYRLARKHDTAMLERQYADLCMQLRQVVASTALKNCGMLPWRDVAGALADECDVSMGHHRALRAQIERQSRVIQSLQRWLLVHASLAQQTLPTDDRARIWQNTTLVRSPDVARRQGMAWIAERLKHHTDSIFHAQGFPTISTPTPLRNDCIALFDQGRDTMYRYEEYVVAAPLSALQAVFGTDFFSFWYTHIGISIETLEELHVKDTHIRRVETLQGYAVTLQWQPRPNQVVCAVQSISDEGEDVSNWPLHRVSKPHSRLNLIVFHEITPIQTKIRQFFHFQDSYEEPLEDLVDAHGLTDKLNELNKTKMAKEEAMERVLNQFAQGQVDATSAFYRRQWQTALSKFEFLAE